MNYEEFAPLPQLKKWVRCYWSFEVEQGRESFSHVAPPDGAVSIAYVREMQFLSLVGPMVDGVRRTIDGGAQFWGIRFEAAGFRPLFGVDIKKLVGRTVPLGMVMPAFAARLLPRLNSARNALEGVSLFEQELLLVMMNAKAIDEQVAAAASRLLNEGGDLSIRNLAIESNLSERQFRRRFVAATGLAPKEFARAQRLRAAILKMVQGEDSLANVAMASGYADQAHMTREVVSVFGESPCSVTERLRRIKHVNMR